jgi:hypothetical protein
MPAQAIPRKSLQQISPLIRSRVPPSEASDFVQFRRSLMALPPAARLAIWGLPDPFIGSMSGLPMSSPPWTHGSLSCSQDADVSLWARTLTVTSGFHTDVVLAESVISRGWRHGQLADGRSSCLSAPARRPSRSRHRRRPCAASSATSPESSATSYLASASPLTAHASIVMRKLWGRGRVPATVGWGRRRRLRGTPANTTPGRATA